MTIATESVNETEIENENQAGDHQRENENRNVNENENEKEIVATNVEILRIVRGIKSDCTLKKKEFSLKIKYNRRYSKSKKRERERK